MRTLLSLLCFCSIAFTSYGQSSAAKVAIADKNKPLRVVEISCGECKLGLPGKSCDLAVRIDGKAYYVDGVDIDALGDAHAADGMCKAIRKAEVQGKLAGDRFKISYIKLLPEVKQADKQ